MVNAQNHAQSNPELFVPFIFRNPIPNLDLILQVFPAQRDHIVLDVAMRRR